MDAYIYKAALLCEMCGLEVRFLMNKAGTNPPHPDIEESYDSDHYPKGPYPDGGGEADTAQHCDRCGVALENPVIQESAPPQPFLWLDQYEAEAVSDDGGIRLVSECRNAALDRGAAVYLTGSYAVAPDLLAALNDCRAVMHAAFEQLTTGECLDPEEQEVIANQLADCAVKTHAAILRATIDPDDPATIEATAAAIIESGDLEGGA